MYDVFVSYSTRGATTKEWVVKFVEDLKKYFSLKYDTDLTVWYALKENETGDNYRDEINEALKECPIFLMILDPKYIIDNPQTLAEVNEYKRVRDELKEPEHFLKIIRWKGSKEKELISYVNSEIVYTSITRTNKDGNEEDCSSSDYINEIQNIVKAVRKRQIEQSRKTNAQKLLQRLKEQESVPKIFVALGYSGSKDARSTFINQLSKTISRATNLKNARIFPDDFTFNLLSYEDLGELFYEENKYGRQCLDALLETSSAAILFLLSDTISEAEDMLGKIRFQLGPVKEAAQVKKLPLHIFSDLPKEMYGLSSYKNELDNDIFASYENIKIIKGIDMNSFIQDYLNDLQAILGNKSVVPQVKDKHIYIIEHHSADDTITETEEEMKAKLEAEKQHRRALRRYLFDRKFVLIPYLKSNANLKDAVDYHKSSLGLSDGIIIYRGIREDEMWCQQQQADAYNILLGLNKAKLIEKAVYVDELQKVREPEEYFYFNYDVLLHFQEDVDKFIWKIQQH